MPLYLLDKEFDTLQIGILVTIGTFIAVFIQPIWGYISDRFQTIKKLLVLLWGGTLLCSVGLFAADGFVDTLVYIVFLYLFLIPSVPLLDSIAITTSELNGTSYGSFRLWGSAGFSLMALFSGLLVIRMGGVDNIQFVYWSIWLLPITLLLFLKDRHNNSNVRVTLKSLKKVLHNIQLLWFLFMVLIIMIPHRMNDSLLGLYMHSMGASPQTVGLAWAIASGSEIPTFALLSKYMHKYHELSLLFIVSQLYMVRWLLYAAADNPFIILILQASHCITFAVFWGVAVQYAAKLVPSHLRTTGQTLLSAVFLGIAGLIGGTIGGWLSDEYGASLMYVFGAMLAAAAMLLLLFTHVLRREKTL